MIAPEEPPGFIVRTEARKAAAANGFRVEQGVERGWLRFGSTTARLTVWIAGASPHGPWLLAIDRPEVAGEYGALPQGAVSALGLDSYVCATLTELYAALDRMYRLAASLPNAPLEAFRAASAELPRATEAERLVIARIGQDVFRKALLDYWGGRCPLTGITDPVLLRASHIVPWADCESDELRLDVHNGLLLSALWDAAFDAGLVSFGDDGTLLASRVLSPEAYAALGLREGLKLEGTTAAHRTNLARHRERHEL
jgi:hypothetical protein